jgi:REP element-mobilizing transposase RayT
VSRPPRIEVAGGIFHVVARGNERRPVFRDDHDRESFLQLLGKVAEQYGWNVLCYCLMTNHYHVLVLTQKPTLARGMRQLNGVYAQRFNRRHNRIGHLWQGRYKSVLVQSDRHLWLGVRYIVRNPIRAQLTDSVGEWRWTSHSAMLGTGPAGITDVTRILSVFGSDIPAARSRYDRYVGDDADPGTAASEHPIIAGDTAFIDQHLQLIDPSPEYPHPTTRPRPPSLANIVVSHTDRAGIQDAYHEHGYTLRQIATHLDCSTATIHRRLRT